MTCCLRLVNPLVRLTTRRCQTRNIPRPTRFFRMSLQVQDPRVDKISPVSGKVFAVYHFFLTTSSSPLQKRNGLSFKKSIGLIKKENRESGKQQTGKHEVLEVSTLLPSLQFSSIPPNHLQYSSFFNTGLLYKQHASNSLLA